MAQVPAIIYKLTITPDEDVAHHHSVILWQVETICDCCGGMTGFVAAAWDFDPERASCYFLPLGKYVNSADITRGVNARAELDQRGSAVQ